MAKCTRANLLTDSTVGKDTSAPKDNDCRSKAVRVKGLSQIGSKFENFFFNKHPFARDGLRAECRGGLKGRLPSRGQGAAAVGWTQSARATKYIEFHGGVRLPHVYLPARSLRILPSVPRVAGRRKRVWLTGRKLRQLVQIQISRIMQTKSNHRTTSLCGQPLEARKF